MYKWILKRRGVDYASLSKELKIDPVCVRILVNRGIDSLEDMKGFLNRDITKLRQSGGLPDIDKSIQLIEGFLKDNKKVRIIGDYDIDGVCSTTILLKGLRAIGLNVDAKIPHRVEDGYGLNVNLINVAHNDGIDAIITCDNGISAKEAIDVAKQHGMNVIITDHHEVPLDDKIEIIPNADAIVNPKLAASTYEEREICGAYVAFKLICALAKKYKDNISEELLLELEELAAFATVGDVMPVIGENRSLIHKGLLQMANSRNIGLRTLIKARELEGKELTTYHIGFILGPCINATGRLDSAERALDLLNTDNGQDALSIANELISINEERIELTRANEEAVYKILDKRIELNGGTLPEDVIVEYLPDCHESIAGIIAGRVRERYNRPAIIMTDGENSLKGSGRSIDEFHMKEHIEKYKDLLLHYGGHKLAAGLSMNRENLDAFKQMINSDTGLCEEDFVRKIILDADMPLSYVNFNLLHDIEKLAPFGAPNTRPLFAMKNVSVTRGRVFEGNSTFAKYKMHDGKAYYDFMLWRNVDKFDELIESKYGKEVLDRLYNGYIKPGEIVINVAYRPEINVYNNTQSIQFVLEDFC